MSARSECREGRERKGLSLAHRWRVAVGFSHAINCKCGARIVQAVPPYPRRLVSFCSWRANGYQSPSLPVVNRLHARLVSKEITDRCRCSCFQTDPALCHFRNGEQNPWTRFWTFLNPGGEFRSRRAKCRTNGGHSLTTHSKGSANDPDIKSGSDRRQNLPFGTALLWRQSAQSKWK